MQESQSDLKHALRLSDQITKAFEQLFDRAPIALEIASLTSEYQSKCHTILNERGITLKTIAIVGSKGQGKTWVAKQFVLDPKIQSKLPSGVLAAEATTELVWIGPAQPPEMDYERESYIHASDSQLQNLGTPYYCLDTPGSTDGNKRAASIATSALSLASIQLIVIRRDQLRSVAVDSIVIGGEGSVSLPVITAVPMKEIAKLSDPSLGQQSTSGADGEELQKDVQRFLTNLKMVAPTTKYLTPIFIEDFEASGDERGAANRFQKSLLEQLPEPLKESIDRTRATQINAAASRLKYEVQRVLKRSAPSLDFEVSRLQDAAKQLPRRVVDMVLGPKTVLETAVRGRLRTQAVSDTSAIWFPFRQTLSLLSLTQGAWDRLVLAMTGSVPSLFATFASWTKNFQQSQKIQWDMQEGLKERLKQSATDQLSALQRDFHRVVLSMRSKNTNRDDFYQSPTTSVTLAGIDELQAESHNIFIDETARFAVPFWKLNLTALIGCLLFWSMLSGPIIATYRQYYIASLHALTTGSDNIHGFPQPHSTFIFTSIFLSYIPMLIFAMLVMTWWNQGRRIRAVAQRVADHQNALIDRLQSNQVLRLEFEDPMLQSAIFLVTLN